MRTRTVNIVNSGQIDDVFFEAKDILSKSGIIAFPTETVYGLGCDIFDEIAIKKLFEIKGRSFRNPMAAHICSIEQVEQLCEFIPDEFYLLAEKFLPGPLSVILKKKPLISNIMTANLDTIAVRYPDNSTALRLIETFGRPLAATSANVSGESSPVNANDVLSGLNGQIPLIIDDGETRDKMESTVISLVDEPRILRQGVISKTLLESALNQKLG